ncbi:MULTISPECIES: hypothetical protein [Streptomyces]|uniref:hypothetical protein n=1 Tax=Streptomyces TaxID=1883 RepID=UPI0029AE1CAF|nr:hypothetical protein [Streptomyces sp. ME02-6978.2a]MDX3363141.1 hypothetical protein [Streptomyces sp. ME02-6978.2a]
MKTTMMFRNIANPRRTTLAHLADAEELQARQTLERPEHTVDLPAQTANPRRTVLMDIPAQPSGSSDFSLSSAAE